MDGVDGEIEYQDEQGRWKRTRQGMGVDRCEHASEKMVDYKLHAVCDMPYVRKREELRLVNAFHA